MSALPGGEAGQREGRWRRGVTRRAAELGRLLTPHEHFGPHSEESIVPERDDESQRAVRIAALEHEPLRGADLGEQCIDVVEGRCRVCREAAVAPNDLLQHPSPRAGVALPPDDRTLRGGRWRTPSGTRATRSDRRVCAARVNVRPATRARRCRSPRRHEGRREPGTVRRTRPAIQRLAARAGRGGHRTKRWLPRATVDAARLADRS